MRNPQVSYLRGDRDYDTLAFTKLGDTIRNGIDPPEQLIPDFLYQQGIHSIYSPGGTGKTIMALWCVVQTMLRKLHVIYCDEENGSNAIAELLHGYGADDKDVDTYIHYAEFPHLTSQETSRWERTVQAIRPSLVVFDSFADMLALEGYDENSSVNVTRWIKHFAQPVKAWGGAVLILDHVNKADSGKGARGSTAKLAKVDVAWKLEGKQFDRNTTAKLTIKKDKDRMGCLPKKRIFTVGGDGRGNIIFDTDEASGASAPHDLTGNYEVAYQVLLRRYPEGATYTKWEGVSTEGGQMSKRTFSRMRKDLVDKEFVEHDEATGLYVANV